MKKIPGIFFLFCLIASARLHAQEFIPLWPKGKKPNSNGLIVTDSLYNERIWRVSEPGIYFFLFLNQRTGVQLIIGDVDE